MSDLSATQFFTLLEQLQEQRLAPVPQLGRLLGVVLRPDPTSTAYFHVQSGSFQPASPFEKLEVRRQADGELRTGITILDLKPTSPAPFVLQADVLQRLGPPNDLSGPQPEAPPEQPTYLVWNRPWGSLRLGFTREAQERLVRVIIRWPD